MHDPQQNSSRQLMSITPRKKSVRFNITSPSPRIPKLLNQTESNHPLNVSYTIPSTTINIDHITNQSHMQHLNNNIEYVPTTRRNNLQIQGEKNHPPTTNLNELQQFMKMKAESLRRNMTNVATTFIHASEHLNHIKEGKFINKVLFLNSYKSFSRTKNSTETTKSYSCFYYSSSFTFTNCCYI